MSEVSTPSPAPPVPTSSTTLAPAGPDDWTVQAADTIESVVGTIRNKAVVPMRTAARGVVFGLIAAILGTVAFVLFLIGVFRVAIVYLPGVVGHQPGRSVWVSDAIVGGIFTLAGLFLLRKANAKPKS